ncbi:MAG TPA: hypothetical protein VGC13_22275 [Longimicrobium sp.]
MASFAWLEQYGKTPMDLGLPLAELDPQWEVAMWLLKETIEDHRILHRPG